MEENCNPEEHNSFWKVPLKKRLPLTRERVHQIDSIIAATYYFYKQELEFHEHIGLQCPGQEVSTYWLEKTLRSYAYSTRPMDFIRGQKGPVKNPRTLEFPLRLWPPPSKESGRWERRKNAVYQRKIEAMGFNSFILLTQITYPNV